MRLKKNWQFRKVYDEGANIVCDCAVIFYCINPEFEEGPCFGVVASKRVGNAERHSGPSRAQEVVARNGPPAFGQIES